MTSWAVERSHTLSPLHCRLPGELPQVCSSSEEDWAAASNRTARISRDAAWTCREWEELQISSNMLGYDTAIRSGVFDKKLDWIRWLNRSILTNQSWRVIRNGFIFHLSNTLWRPIWISKDCLISVWVVASVCETSFFTSMILNKPLEAKGRPPESCPTVFPRDVLNACKNQKYWSDNLYSQYTLMLL